MGNDGEGLLSGYQNSAYNEDEAPPYQESTYPNINTAAQVGATTSASAPPPLMSGQYQPVGYQTMQQPTYIHTTQVILVGGCPVCRVGVLEDDYSCLGILCAILFFPLGVLCCLMTRQRRCSNCGAIYG